MKNWSNNDIIFLKENYAIHGVEYCCNYLNRTKLSVCKKARENNLRVLNDVKILNIINKRRKNNYLKYDVSKITKIENKYSAYVLGYLWADGHIRKDGYYMTSINLIKEDAEYIYSIINKTSTGWTIGNEIKKFWKNSDGVIIQAKNQRIIRSFSQELYYYLNENDYSDKSNTGFYKIWNKIPEIYKNFFILGLYDGDGHFNYQLRKEKYHSGEFVITASYNYDWSVLEDYLNINNIEYSIYRQIVKLGRVSKIVVRKKESLIKLYNLLYSDDFNGLERKHKKYLKYKELNDRCYTI